MAALAARRPRPSGSQAVVPPTMLTAQLLEPLVQHPFGVAIPDTRAILIVTAMGSDVSELHQECFCARVHGSTVYGPRAGSLLTGAVGSIAAGPLTNRFLSRRELGVGQERTAQLAASA